MSFFGKLIGAGVGESVKGISEGIGSLAKDLRSAITGELPPEKRAQLEMLAQKGDQLANQGQMEVNKIEAAHSSIFIAGWRPFVGWVCGVALAWNYVMHPILLWILTFSNISTQPPKLSMTELFPVVLGMLGLGAYRSYEKKHDAESNR